MPIRSYPLTLWLDGQLWEHGFLRDPGGTVTLYSSSRYSSRVEFNAATLPEGVRICPNLTHGHAWAPVWAQDDLREAALRYGFKIFEIDLMPE